MHRNAGEARQTIATLKGEIEFRAKLSRQHVSGEVLLPDYYRKEQHDEILRTRVAATLKKMTELEGRGIPLSPFLELGAERGQRSLVLVNDFGADGFAVDISYHQLRTVEHFARLFQRDRLPIRVCCDAYHLPFRSNAFPFVFCYEFLHHFPSLPPILAEIHRVIGNGYLYFAEEPFRKLWRLVLYQQRHKIYSEAAAKKHRLVKLLEEFISEQHCDEVEHGIVENYDISVRDWRAALARFDEVEATLVSSNGMRSRLKGRVGLRNVPNLVLGGNIAALCRKTTPAGRRPGADLYDLLACPSCTVPSEGGGLDRPPLVREGDRFRCSRCRVDYGSRDGILFLLPREECQQLYPDL